MRRIKDKGPLALTMTVALVIALRQFLDIYNFDEQFAMITAGILCLGLWLFPHWSLRLLWTVGLYAGTLYHYFPLGQSFGSDWLQALWRQLRPLLVMVRSEGFGRTPSLLAFSLIFLALCLIAVLGIEYELIGLSYLSLLGYFLLLSIFNHLDLVPESLAILLCALLAAGFRHYRNAGGQRQLLYFLLGSVLLGGLFFGVQFVPDAWVRDPLARESVGLRNRLNETGLYSFVEKVGVGGNTRTGFGENDEALGGALVDDATVLFQATQAWPHYWRVDTKDEYSGKGWKQQTSVRPQITEDTTLALNHSETDNFLRRQEIEVTFESTDTYLPLPYGNPEISLVSGFTGFAYFENTQRVNLLVNEEAERRLTMISQEPAYPVAALQQVSVVRNSSLAQYLKLPGSLPERVGELAREITQDATNLYDQVTEVETYLNSSEEFRYSKVDVVAPLVDQDYVDQFLFESKVGYCDNFSTAMVVMLRTLGIPARWAKGFSPGTAIPSFEERKTYEIKNLNAHSWPEVYFSGYGWVPFEPTPAFNNPARPGTSTEETPEESSEAAEETTASSSTTASTTTETQTSVTREAQSQEEAADTEESGQSRHYLPWLLLAFVIGAGFMLYRYGEVLVLIVIAQLAKEPLRRGYPYLLRRLERRLPRQSGETLDTYSQKVVNRYPELIEFETLTRMYEAYLYGQQLPTQKAGAILQVLARRLPKIK